MKDFYSSLVLHQSGDIISIVNNIEHMLLVLWT